MRVDDDLDDATGVRVDFQRDPGVKFKYASLGDSRTIEPVIALLVDRRIASD